jgi:hypothetical protein
MRTIKDMEQFATQPLNGSGNIFYINTDEITSKQFSQREDSGSFVITHN